MLGLLGAMRECHRRCGRRGENQAGSLAYAASPVIVFAYDITGMEPAVSDIVTTIPTGKADNVGRRRRIT